MVELEKEVAKRLDIDEEQVHIVITDLFKSVRTYLQNPHTVKNGVKINRFAKFNLKYNTIQRYIDMREANLVSDKNAKGTLQYFKELINKKDEYGNSKK